MQTKSKHPVKNVVTAVSQFPRPLILPTPTSPRLAGVAGGCMAHDIGACRMAGTRIV